MTLAAERCCLDVAGNRSCLARGDKPCERCASGPGVACVAGVWLVEIKSARQPRVKSGFAGFFLALTESEVVAAEAWRPRHRVALYNRLTGELQLTSVPEILARAKSTNWQLSGQRRDPGGCSS